MLSSFFRPGYLKEADLLARNARKLLHRRRDLLSDAQYDDYSKQIAELETVVRNGAERKHVEALVERIDKSFGKLHPARDDAGWRENCEVLLVAFVLAVGIRAYFLQPFKIPTGSMEPTLNGINVSMQDPKTPLPGVFRRVFDYLWLGRTYADAVSEADDQITGTGPVKHWLLFNYTRIQCASGRSYDVYVPPEQIGKFGVAAPRKLRAGESIIHGWVDTGDQVFVDKFTYNFRMPHREDVFVFSTAGIRGITEKRRADMDPNVTSEFYIKRLAGTPHDILRIEAPVLFINGARAQGRWFERVIQADAKEGYHGYTNQLGMVYLRTPEDKFTVPADCYFALGDNSRNSSDSRDWGTVPAHNVVGRGLFVYYPFTRHWGVIH